MLLKLAGIGKLFGARAVLRNISFEVHPGTVTLLVGANGAGKTEKTEEGADAEIS